MSLLRTCLSLLLFAHAVQGCIVPRNGWADVCNYETHECMVSDAFCAPYSSLSLVLDTPTSGFQTSRESPGVVLFDAVERNGTTPPSACATNSDDSVYTACKNALKSTTGNVKYWDFGAQVIPLSFLTFKPLQDAQKVHVRKTRPTIRSRNSALCRCFEFLGDFVHLERVICDVTDCVAFFLQSFQYRGDDGALVAFSGASAAFSSVTQCEFRSVAHTAASAFRAATTGVRFGSDRAEAQLVDQVVLAGNVFHNLDYAASFWDVASQFAREPIRFNHSDSTCTPLVHNSPCVVSYKQAYPTAVPFLWDSVTDATEQNPIPASRPEWYLSNASVLVPPSFQYLRPTAIRPGLTDNVNLDQSNLVTAAVFFSVGSLVFLLAVVVLIELYRRSRGDDN
jgi:hypothetical protein